MSDPGAELELMKQAARAAGAVVMQYFGQDLSVWHKAPDQPLTEADLAANRLLHEQLMGARPAYGWLSEETVDSADRLTRERVWIVDPIDGTRSFIARRPEFSLSIGLAEAGRPIAGVVFNPARDELFYAARGSGSFVERQGAPGVRLQSGGGDARELLRMLASRSEIAAGEFDAFRDAWQIHPAGSTAYKLACVAAAAGEAFVSRGPKSEWDICAGVLILEEAGGRATDVSGAVPRFNGPDPYVHGIIAAGSALHGALLRRVRALPPTERLQRQARDPKHPGLKRGDP